MRLRSAIYILVSLYAIIATPIIATAQTVTGATCDKLTVKLSDDKNYYIFTATASGDAETITGYTFNFGDNQSYDYVFSATSSDDRHTATTTHTYQVAGEFTASVRVNRLVDNKTSSAGSEGCKAHISIATMPSDLPNTGANVTWWVAAAVLAGYSLHQVWLRKYKLR